MPSLPPGTFGLPILGETLNFFTDPDFSREFARLEMKIFATHLLRHWQWALLPDQDLSRVVIPTPHPRDGLRATFSALEAG